MRKQWKRWIVVANRTGAKVFDYRGRIQSPVAVTELQNPQGKLRARDIDSDRPGRSQDNRGATRHAFSTEQNPTEHVAERFTHRIAQTLEKHYHMRDFEELVLVAEPHVLGLIRKQLPDIVAKKVVSSVHKDFDLSTLREKDLLTQLHAS